jgi:ubiquinone/menaquinone biosynthesis C-methylase UbiE
MEHQQKSIMNTHWTGERLETFVFAETTLEHLHRYALALSFTGGKVVLDIACGEGYGAHLLAEKAEQVIGVDIDEQTINHAIKKYRKSNLGFKRGSAIALPVESNQFDVVVSFETLEHLKEHDQMLAEIKRVLKPGGVVIMSTPDKKNYSDEPGYKNVYHLKELYKEEFSALLQLYFKNQRLLQQSFVYGSLLIEKGTTTIRGFTGNFDNIIQELPKSLYWVIVASDEPLPETASSIFYDKQFLNTILRNEMEAVKGTITYRLGHFLLLPFKWLASMKRP